MLGYKQLRKELEKQFISHDIDDFSDIDWIICEITGKSRSMLGFIDNFSEKELDEIYSAVSKRLQHIPIAYIFGKTNFYGYDFVVNNNVLIPRIDTEILIETAIAEINKKPNSTILDIGTGSGIVAVVLSKETDAKAYAVDVSEMAIEVAKKNAKANNVDVEFILSDIYENIGDLKVDFIISNPPYIESDVVLGLESEVKDNEPILALDGGVDGLDYYRRIVSGAKNHLNQNGFLLFEIGYNQAEAVSMLMEKDFKNIRVIKDYGNNDRVVMGELI